MSAVRQFGIWEGWKDFEFGTVSRYLGRREGGILRPVYRGTMCKYSGGRIFELVQHVNMWKGRRDLMNPIL